MNNLSAEERDTQASDEATALRRNANLVRELYRRERQLATVVEYNPTGIMLLDQAGRVLLRNPVAAALIGRPNPAGLPIEEALPLEDEQGRLLPLPLATGEGPVTVQGYLRVMGSERPRFLQVSLMSVHHDEAGMLPEVEGYVVNIVDLTALKEAENAKNAFLAGLSHELKTPLALIRGYAENLRYPQVHEDREMYKESLDVILEETRHLTQIVDQLLLAARLHAGALSLDLHEVALDRMLGKLIEEYREVEPGYHWQLTIAGDIPPITADPGRLRAVFHNLLSNACKYSDPGTRIEVHAEAAGMGVRVSIRDEGIGIGRDEQAKLFQRFYRASDRADGTGLGLYMSKAIVEAHGGRIIVDSEEGEGSTFTVELPRARTGRGRRQQE